jgi:hypothetical protein
MEIGAADGGNMRAIENMVRDMGITPWSDAILRQYQHAAEKFVRETRNGHRDCCSGIVATAAG